jgi:hypothetical protein
MANEKNPFEAVQAMMLENSKGCKARRRATSTWLKRPCEAFQVPMKIE